MKEVVELKEELATLAKLGAALGVLGWDEEVNMPAKGHGARGDAKAALAAELHRRMTAKNFIRRLEKLYQPSALSKLSPGDKVIVRETWRDTQKALKLPTSFVEKLSKLTSEAFAAWTKARAAADFVQFASYLEQVVAAKREEAELLGYSGSPYDALLDSFEPEMTAKQLDELFAPLAAHLSKLIKQLEGSSPVELPKVVYNLDSQMKLANAVSADLGYDLQAGRIDESAHPFTVGLHPTDVRITTRFDETDFWVCLGSTIHEVGHALYEQGLLASHYGTPLGEAVSLGIHESQSRIWENFVGRSHAFSEYLLPLLKQHFPDQPIRYNAAELYRWLNRVQPSLIRVEADEVTYNLHIILRYELEKDLIEGRLSVAELPDKWNHKVKQYLNLDVPNDALGVLQDVHWSHGYLGYFPTYALGNLYAAQLYRRAQSDLPRLESGFAKGQFQPFLKWLRLNIHRHGRRYHPDSLIKRVTGENLQPAYLDEHLQQRVQLNLSRD